MRLPLSRDGWLLFATCGVRSFAYGFLSVVLGLYLDAIGLTTTAIGWIFTAALAGGAVMTIVITTVADSFGRKTLLILGAVLMATAGWVFAISNDPLVLTLAAIFGTISPSGKEVGPFLSIEQAILPETTQDQHRTTVFSAYNLIGSLCGALGALAVGLAVTIFISANYWLPVSSLGLRDLRRRDDGSVRLTITGHRDEDQNGFAEASDRRATITRHRCKISWTFRAGCFRWWFHRAKHRRLLVLPPLQNRSEHFGRNFLRNESSGRPLLPRRARDRPAFRTPKHYGLHSSTVKYLASASAVDAQLGAGSCNAARTELTLTARRTDAPVVYDGSRRS